MEDDNGAERKVGVDLIPSFSSTSCAYSPVPSLSRAYVRVKSKKFGHGVI
jgi:hypothetical protein